MPVVLNISALWLREYLRPGYIRWLTPVHLISEESAVDRSSAMILLAFNTCTKFEILNFTMAATIQRSTHRIFIGEILSLLEKGCRINREAKFLDNLRYNETLKIKMPEPLLHVQ